MEFRKILIAPKMTGLEWDMTHYKLSMDEMTAKYRQDGADVERIVAAHERQKAALFSFVTAFPEAETRGRTQLTKDAVAQADLVIALGGDNHTTYVSHFVNQTYFLPINSDPVLSEGTLTSAGADARETIVDALQRGNYEIEHWTRLEACLNGNPLRPCSLSEIYLGKTKRRATSRYNLFFDGKKEEQKSSGVIIATGAGSTGWYDSEVRYVRPEGDVFPRTDEKAKFIVTAPFHGKLNSYSIVAGALFPGNELRIQSLKDASEIALDPQEEDVDVSPFNRGAIVSVRISDNPLRVIKPTLST